MCGADTSRQKRVDVEQLLQRVKKQLLKMGQERTSRLLEKLWARYWRLEQVETEREVLPRRSSGKHVEGWAELCQLSPFV